MHRDHVPVVPPSFHLLASTPISPVHGLIKFSDPTTEKTESLEDVHILTVQGHPEFTKPIVSVIVEKRRSTGVIDAKTADEFGHRKDLEHDGPLVGRAIWKVLGVVEA